MGYMGILLYDIPTAIFYLLKGDYKPLQAGLEHPKAHPHNMWAEKHECYLEKNKRETVGDYLPLRVQGPK